MAGRVSWGLGVQWLRVSRVGMVSASDGRRREQRKAPEDISLLDQTTMS